MTFGILLLMAPVLNVHAQMSDHRFNRMYSEAFEELLIGNHAAALPMLQVLQQARPDNAQMSYLLGMTLLRTGKDVARAADLLRMATGRFNPEHRHGHPDDVTAPGNAFLLLGDALAAIGQNKEAIGAYRTYMTTIAMAPIQRKSEVIQRIREVRALDAALVTTAGAFDGQLAILTK